MLNVYCLRNRKISAYLNPFFAVEDKESEKTQLARYCILQNEEAKQKHFDEAELYFLGTYDDTRAKFDLLPDPEFLCALDTYFNEVKIKE